MGISLKNATYGPKIITNGLVLALDAANPKSYDGNENLITYSEQFDNAAWGKTNTTVQANSISAPDNNITADKLVENSANGIHILAQGAGTISGTYTLSCFVKAAGRYKGYIQLFGNGGNAAAFFDLNLGTITGGAGTNTITAYPNGWYRITSTATFTTETAAVYIVMLDNSGNSTYTGDGTSGIYLWGAQVEKSLTVNPYYPTTGTSKTRGTTWTDLSGIGNTGTLVNTPSYNTSGYFTFSYLSTQSVSFTSSSSLQFLNRLPYTLEAWVYPTRNPGANNWTGIFDRESDIGSGRDGYNMYFLGSGGTDTYFFTERFTSGSYNAVPVTLNQSITVNNWHHVVGTYDGTTLTLYRNGSSVGTPVTTTGNITNSSKTLTLGVRGGQYFDGRISNAKTYNRALTAAEVSQNFNATRGRYGI